MLAAALLIASPPSGLDRAFERASEAVKKAPTLHWEYSFEVPEGSDMEPFAFRYWKNRGNERFDIGSDEKMWVRGYKTPDRVLLVLPTQRQYIDSKDAKLWETANKGASIALEPDHWQFRFGNDFRFILECNPPFRVQSQGLVRRNGHDVRVIRFQSTSAQNDWTMTGRAEFDERSKLFLGATLEDSSDSTQYVIRRKTLDTAAPAPSLFKVDEAQLQGLERIIAGKE